VNVAGVAADVAVDVAVIVRVGVAVNMAVDAAVILGASVAVDVAVGFAVGDSVGGGRGTVDDDPKVFAKQQNKQHFRTSEIPIDRQTGEIQIHNPRQKNKTLGNLQPMGGRSKLKKTWEMPFALLLALQSA
jgi:hypothetical protein